mgnify:CR=1 FL=1
MNNPSVRILVAPSWELAQTMPDPTITIEAEWGKQVLEGSRFTACHHQPGQELWPAPCNNILIPSISEGTIVLSHLDHDCIGGTLRALGHSHLFTTEYQSFWDLAEDTDKNGPMVMPNHSEEDQDRMNALWAYLKSLPFVSRSEVTDVTENIFSCSKVIQEILEGNVSRIETGKQWVKYNAELADSSLHSVLPLRRIEGGLQVRVVKKLDPATGKGGFVNHLYGEDAAIAAFCQPIGTITISQKDPTVTKVVCRDIMQNLFGPEAGGHAGIAGGLREGGHTLADFEKTVTTFQTAMEWRVVTEDFKDLEETSL